MFASSDGKEPVPISASSRTSTGGRTGVKPLSARRSSAAGRARDARQRGVAHPGSRSASPDIRAARSMSKLPISRCSRGSCECGGSPDAPDLLDVVLVVPSGDDSVGGFGISQRETRRGRPRPRRAPPPLSRGPPSPAAAPASCSGVGLPFSFVFPRSSSIRGTSARQRSSASSAASKASAAPLRASAAR